MATKETTGKLRLTRIASDSILRETIVPGERLNRREIKAIAFRTNMILREMETEWELNPESQELREGFHLLGHYLEYLQKYCGTEHNNKKEER